MKKLNNKGFAIGTILYGLLIVMVLLMSLLMSTMAFGRSNSKKYVDEIVNNLEIREKTPPSVTITGIPGTLRFDPPYQDVSIDFKIKIEDESSIIVYDNFVTLYNNTPVSCTLDNSSTGKSKIYNCNITVSNENAKPGQEVRIVIGNNKIRDRFHNWYPRTELSLNHKFESDTIPPTMTPYRVSVSNRCITYKILVCDNSGKNVTIDYSKANNITVADETRLNVNATNNNNCKLVSVDSSIIRDKEPIPVKIPEGVFIDKYNNVNQENTINFLNPLPDKNSHMNNFNECRLYAYISKTNDENGFLLTPEFKNETLKYQVRYKINSPNGMLDNDRQYYIEALQSKCKEIKQNEEKLKIKYGNENLSVSSNSCTEDNGEYVFTYNIKRSMLEKVKKMNSGYSSRLYLKYPVTTYNRDENKNKICEYLNTFNNGYYIDTGLDY